jgi:hypothetical protein
MEELILKIAEQLLAVSIGFVGLIFTSLSIIMTLNNDNWKIKRLKKSKQFEDFVGINANTAIGFIVLFIISILLLSLKKILLFEGYLIYGLYSYLFYLFYLSYRVIVIAYRYKQIIILTLDDSKPTISD